MGDIRIFSKSRWLLHSVRLTARVTSATSVPVPHTDCYIQLVPPVPMPINRQAPPTTQIVLGGGFVDPPILRVSCPREAPRQFVGWVFEGDNQQNIIQFSVSLAAVGSAGDGVTGYLEIWFIDDLSDPGGMTLVQGS